MVKVLVGTLIAFTFISICFSVASYLSWKKNFIMEELTHKTLVNSREVLSKCERIVDLVELKDKRSGN